MAWSVLKIARLEPVVPSWMMTSPVMLPLTMFLASHDNEMHWTDDLWPLRTALFSTLVRSQILMRPSKSPVMTKSFSGWCVTQVNGESCFSSVNSFLVLPP